MKNKHNGFTLVELMIATSLALLSLSLLARIYLTEQANHLQLTAWFSLISRSFVINQALLNELSDAKGVELAMALTPARVRRLAKPGDYISYKKLSSQELVSLYLAKTRDRDVKGKPIYALFYSINGRQSAQLVSEVKQFRWQTINAGQHPVLIQLKISFASSHLATKLWPLLLPLAEKKANSHG